MPESENRTKYAVNPETGQVMRNDGTGWKKVQTAKNQAGDILINENGVWGPVPGRSAQPAPAGFASVPKMSMGQAAQVAGAQGREIGLSDEARGFRAMAGIPEGLNQAYQAVNPLGRFTSIGTGLAGLAGEAMGVMPESYTQARDVERQQLAQARQDRPVTAFGSELAQAAVYPAGTLRMGAPIVGQMAKLGGIGAAQGGVMGYAAGEGDTEDRLQAGGIGTVAGGVLGAAMPGLGAAATPVYRAGTTAVANAVDAVVRLFGGTSNLADANARRVAEAAVRRSMERSNMTPEQIAANLERFRDKPAVLAEIIGQDALNALTALTRRPGATPEMAQDIIAGRFGGLGERIASDVRQAAPNVTEPQIAGQFGPELAERRGRAAPAYRELFERYGNVGSDRLDALAQTTTLSGPIGRARNAAADVAIAEGRDPASVTPLEVMDLAKREIDDKIGTAVANENFEEVRRLEAVQSAMLRELDNLTEGQYAAVREIGGEAPRLQAARRLGERWRQIRLPQFLQDIAGVNPQDLTALRAGIMSQIDDRLNRGTLNPREFRTRDVQQKIRAVFGPEAGDELIRRVTAEAELRETGARFAPRVQSVTGTVAENAPEEFLNDAIGVVEQVRRGNIAGTMQAIGSFMRRRGYGQRQIDEMGRLLLSDPEEGLRRLGISLPTAPGGGGTAANAFTAGGGGPTAGGPSGGAGPTPNAMAAPVAEIATETGNAFTTPYLGRQSFRGQGPITGPATQARQADWETTVPALAQVSNTGQQASEVAAQALQNRTPEALAAAQQAKAMLRSEIEGIVQTRAGMATPEDQRLVDALSALAEQTNDPVLIGTQISNARLQLDRVLESLGQQRPGNLTPVRTTPPFRVTPSPEQQARTIPDRQSRTRYAGGTPPDETQMGLGPNAFIQAGLGSAGGSVAGSQTDLNGDGVIDMQDVAIGSVMGGVGLPLAGRAASRLDNALAGNRGVRGMGFEAGKSLPNFKANPKEGQGFDEWLEVLYSNEMRGSDNKIQLPNVFYRGMSDAEFNAAQSAGVFKPISGDGLYVEKDPTRYTGGGAYGAKRGGYIVQFDTSGLTPKTIPSRTQGGFAEDAFDQIPINKIARVWKWDPNKNDHVLIGESSPSIVSSMGFGGSDLPKPVQQARQAGYQGADTGESKEWLSAIRKGLRMDTESRMARAREMGFDTDEVFYHGTGDLTNFSVGFDPNMTGLGNDQLGSGFYFTNQAETASGYTTRRLPTGESKLGGEDAPGVLPVVLNIKNPIVLENGTDMLSQKVEITAEQAEAIIRQSPLLAEDVDNNPLGNWHDIWSEGAQDWMIGDVASSYEGNTILSIENDFFKGHAEAFRRAVRDVLGYDGVIQKFNNGEVHKVAWFPEQVRSVHAAFDPEKSSSPELLAGLPFAVGGAGLGMGAMQSEERPNAFVQ